MARSHSRKETYEEFTERLKEKHTRDDVFTPEPIYNAIVDFCSTEYGVDEQDIVRPFYPGGDYENFEYPEGCVVVDNQPFSLTAKIIRFYLARNIKFFIFGPSLQGFNGLNNSKCSVIFTGEDIVYADGAKIPTCFYTNLEPVQCIRTAPELTKKFSEFNESLKKNLPKFTFPANVIRSVEINEIAKKGVELKIDIKDVKHISALDEMKRDGKSIFGGGFLLNTRTTAVLEQARKQPREIKKTEQKCYCWNLTERELNIIKELDKEDYNNG